jgi:hypothetical protein
MLDRAAVLLAAGDQLAALEAEAEAEQAEQAARRRIRWWTRRARHER